MVIKSKPGFRRSMWVGPALLAASTALLPAQARAALQGYTAIGDSITVGYWADASATEPATDSGGEATFTHGFSRQVLAAIVAGNGYDAAKYHNRAVTGAAATNALSPGKGVAENQLANAVADNPDTVSLTVGGNDVKNFFLASGAANSTKIGQFRAAFQPAMHTILDGLRANAPDRGIVMTNVPKLWLLPGVYDFGQAPSPDEPTRMARQFAAKTAVYGYIAAANDIIAKEALLSRTIVLDIFDDPIATDANNVSAIDGFHPSRAGHDALAAKALALPLVLPERPSLVVTTGGDDSTYSDGETSLREAVAYANAKPGADTITFVPALAGQTISLKTIDPASLADTPVGTAADEITAFGSTALLVTSDITIQGRYGNSGVTLAKDASIDTLRLFGVSGAGSLTLRSLTLSGWVAKGGTGGSGTAAGGGAGAGLGGAIFNAGTLTVSSCTFQDNTVYGGNAFTGAGVATGGGGLAGEGSAGVGGGPNGGVGSFPAEFGGGGGSDGANGGDGGFGGGGGGGSTTGGRGGFGGGAGGGATDGQAGYGGGAGSAGGGAGLGGAIFNHGGTVSLTNSTFSNCRAYGGAGAVNFGHGYGGGLFSRNGAVSLTNCTFSNAIAEAGGGIYLLGDAGTVTYNAVNNIFANTGDGGTDAAVDTFNSGTVTAGTASNNLVELNGAGGDALSGVSVTSDPELVALAGNGGPTQTFELGPTSPANSAGTTMGAPQVDQRGALRPGTPDIGSYEAGSLGGPNFVVTTLEDTDDGDYSSDDISLREAITFANIAPDQSVIGFKDGLSGTIELTSVLPDLTTEMELRGPGADVINVRRESQTKFRILRVSGGATVAISGLTISNGATTNEDYFGAGVLNDHSTLSITACTIRDNTDVGGGGGVGNNGENGEASLVMTDCTLSGNSVTGVGLGGAVLNAGFNGNASVAMIGCTVSGNTANSGGALGMSAGDFQISHCTFYKNTASFRGGTLYSANGNFQQGSSILLAAGPTNALEVASLSSGGYNVISGSDEHNFFTGLGDKINTDPLLAPLADNGGPTQTHALLDNSPAIDGGNPTFVAGPTDFDQRGPGYPRVNHGRVDSGAFEATTLTVTVKPGSPSTVSEAAGAAATTLRVTRDGNTVGPVTVSLRVPSGVRLKAPSSVVIGDGVAFKDFPVNAVNTSLVEGDEDYIVRATAPGTAYVFDAAGTVRVTDDEASSAALTATIAPGAFTEGAKPSVVLTVSHNRSAKSPAVTVNLSSTDARYTLPATITIAANTRTKSVTIPFTADAVNQGTVDSTIVATASGFTGSTAHATVYDSLAELSLAVAPPYSASFGESTVPTGRTGTVLRLGRNTPLNQALDVIVTVKSGVGQITLPALVTIPAGQSFVDVPVESVNDANVDGLQRVVVEAKAAGFKGVKGVNLYVYDDDTVAPPISAPAVSPVAVSPVALSAATADAAKGTVTLTFTGAVGASAGDATNYGVTAGGVELAVTGVARRGTNSVELAVDGLTAGTGVTVSYDIVDANGRTLRGTTKATAR